MASPELRAAAPQFGGSGSLPGGISSPGGAAGEGAGINQDIRESRYGGMAKPAMLERMPTYARLDRQASRPKTLGVLDFERSGDVGKSDEDEEEREIAQSARAAFRSWSITGGTRDASFKKRPKLSKDEAGSEADGAPAAAAKPRSVGFAAVLSMSGWSEADAEEMEVEVKMPPRQAATASGGEGGAGGAPSSSSAGVADTGTNLEALTVVDDEPPSTRADGADESFTESKSMRKRRLQ